MAPGFFSSLSALALGLGTGSLSVSFWKEAQSSPACPTAAELCVPCAPFSLCLEQGFTGSPAPFSPLQLGLLAIGSINLLVMAFLLGRCSVHSRAADQQVQHVRVGPQAYPIGNDGDCHLSAARARAYALR